MADVTTLLREFVDQLGAGRMPEAAAFIERAATDAERRELAGLIDLALAIASEPSAGPATGAGGYEPPLSRTQIEALVDDALAPPRGWRELLPQLRTAAGLSIAQTAQQTLVAGGLEPSEQNVRAAGSWLERMEDGKLRARDLSRAALAALGRVLGVSADDLAWEGGVEAPDSDAVFALRADTDVPPDLESRLGEVADMLAGELESSPASEVDRWFAA
jgi:transcriptional regulator with XRE-family HTH domain